MCDAVVDSRNAVGADPARGRVRHLKGFRVEVNGRVYARLAANKTNITLKKCKSGMKYTCVVVVMTCPEQSVGHQRKVRRTVGLISSLAQLMTSFLFLNVVSFCGCFASLRNKLSYGFSLMESVKALLIT